MVDRHRLQDAVRDDDDEIEQRLAREAMVRPLFEEPVDIERESAWDDPKGFLIGGMVRGTIQETANQYINAANVIIDAIKRDEIEDFRLAHPALFLYRHAVELMLKATVPNAGKVHRLDKLADRFKNFVKAEFGEDVPGWIMDRLRELAQVDPNSTTFRYAHEGIDGDEVYVDLAHLQRAMAALQDAFDRVYGGVFSQQLRAAIAGAAVRSSRSGAGGGT